MRYFKNVSELVVDKQVFCGIDVHLKHWDICLICDGEVVEQRRLYTDYRQLKGFLMSYSTARRIRVVYEAGFSGFWLYRRLCNDGYDCMVTPPSKLPKTGDKVKTDKRDAEKLATYLAAGLLKSLYVPTPSAEADRRVIRRRAQLVKKQTRAKNEIKAFLRLHNLHKPTAILKSWTREYHEWLESLAFEHAADAFTFRQMITSYLRLRDDLAQVTRYLRMLSQNEKYRENYGRLTTLRGVGLITAMTFLLELFEMSRFKNGEHFSSYLGLTPGQFSSGQNIRLGRITRQGNAHLRHVLVESAWTVIRHDPHLRAKYERIRARGTNGKKAIVAVARTLAVRLRRCLLDEKPYVIAVAVG